MKGIIIKNRKDAQNYLVNQRGESLEDRTMYVKKFSNLNKPKVIDLHSAREFLIDAHYANTNRRRIANSVGLGLMGAGAGLMAGKLASTDKNNYGGIGAAVGGLIGGISGYNSPNLITNDEKARTTAIEILQELGWSWVVIVDPKTGKTDAKYFESPVEANNYAKAIKAMGKKGYVVPLDAFNNLK